MHRRPRYYRVGVGALHTHSHNEKGSRGWRCFYCVSQCPWYASARRRRHHHLAFPSSSISMHQSRLLRDTDQRGVSFLWITIGLWARPERSGTRRRFACAKSGV
ncbi:hypothetical protein LZ32DRAFT_183740 [Colletotrichum eremochloae]|nr:hypothetical protein LZ32DRAFT_183740 [Colletotrichum eremochloae]